MDDPKVGDVVYYYDSNSRHYDEDRKIIRRKCYVETTISGQTSRSWVVGPSYNSFKIPKKDPWGHHGGELGFVKRLFTAEMVDQQIWMKDNRYEIERKLNSASFKQLKEVAKILNYEEKK